MSRPQRWRLVAASTFIAAVLALPASAAPRLGTTRPDVRLDDAWDRAVSLGRYRGMPTLVVYEDKDSASQNQALKDELSELAKGDRYKNRVALIAVADVSSYNFWPARGFVKDAIRAESRKVNTLIFCDWDGAVRRTLGMRAKASNVVLYGRDDRVVFAYAGALSPQKRGELVEHLRVEVEAYAASR